MKPGFHTGEEQNWFLPTRASIDYMHGLNNENKRITRYAVNLSKIMYIPEKVPKEINRNNVLKKLMSSEETFSRFLDPSRKLISVDYMLNVINAASMGAINKLLSSITLLDSKLFRSSSKLKAQIKKEYLEEYCIEKGIEDPDFKKQLKCSLNKLVTYDWIKTPCKGDSMSDSEDMSQADDNSKLWDKAILVTVSWVYGLDRYYSDSCTKVDKNRIEMELAKVRFIIKFPRDWLPFITKPGGSMEEFDGFQVWDIGKGEVLMGAGKYKSRSFGTDVSNEQKYKRFKTE